MTRAPGTLGILVLDDEPNVRRALARLDLGPAMQLLPAATAAEADALVDDGSVDVVLVDEHLGPGQPRGLDWLAWLQAKDPDCFRIIFTGAADLDFAVRAINGGVIDAFLTKPWSDEQVIALMHQGAEASLLRRHNRALLQELAQRNADLLGFNENLERLVEERTANLREAHEHLKQQQQALIRLETQGLLSHLAMGLAHELNNPLAVILGYAQRLKRQSQEPDLVRRLDIILTEVDRCRSLVDQLRHIAAPLDEDTVPLSPEEMLGEVIRRRNEAGRPTPALEIGGQVPEVIAAPGALRRVLNEVLDNAVIAGAKTVVLGGETEYERAILCLGNDGVTPSEDEVTNAIKPFFTTRAAQGARGLGLAVAAGLLRDQDGHIELAARADGGALVVITLPAKIGSGVVSALAPADREFAGLTGAVLVVDDDILVGELLADVLHDLGAKTILARTCGEARAALAQAQIVAVLSDRHLPDGSGEALLDECEAAGLHGRVAMISGDLPPAGTSRPALGKPFRCEQVGELLRHLVQAS